MKWCLLLVADVFNNFQNMFLEIYWQDSESAPELAWQAALKNKSKTRSTY